LKDKKQIELKAQIEMLEQISRECAINCASSVGDAKLHNHVLLSKILEYLNKKRSELKDIED
jgi:hypothetical protein